MKPALRMITLAGLLMAGLGSSTEAGYCGADSFNCCPTSACAPSGDFRVAQVSCNTCYQTVQDIVYDKCTVTRYRTEWNTVCEQQPVHCTRNVYETKFREECFQVCKPVYS